MATLSLFLFLSLLISAFNFAGSLSFNLASLFWSLNSGNFYFPWEFEDFEFL